ncbi:carbohydrate-binding module family 50 protein [Lentinula edodes]|uniref:Carbohydrate-binding module family 50 protein n=1 Tax=Lentinula edodes TaxID=5353 RepID=A0A1Q3EMD4_LENED|nr:carbohydrate-binding module family 50 protein [Lentinula edodes]
MSRFTQYSEDSTRLPVGLQRIAYDADTQQYTFRDENGRLYYSASGESYGCLTSAGNGSAARAGEVPMTEPKPKRSPTSRSSPSLPAPKSFYDILPPESIASAGSTTSLKSSPSPSSPSSSSSTSSPTSPSPTSPRSTPSPRSRFIAAAKRSTIPRMQSVVQGLMRREVTVGKRRGEQTRTYPSGHRDQDGGGDEEEDDRAGLLRTHSVVSRSSTVRTSQSSGVTLVEETGEGY